jgi:carbon starvation protein
MNSLLVLLLGAVAIVLGYFVYARHIDRKIVQPDAKKATPARMYMDGVDFTPASRNVLFGYQFKSCPPSRGSSSAPSSSAGSRTTDP